MVEFMHMFGGYRLEIIVGCMNAGKSSELIRRIERARLAYLPTVIVRPTTDTRSKPDHVETRNGRALQAVIVDAPKDILKISSQAVVIGIDECQFFSDDIIDIVQILLKQKKKIIASGLDLDYTGRPFGPVPQLLAMADRIDKLLAVCRKCGSEFACRTQRLVQSNEQILVGDAQYEARCINCFDPPHEFQLQIPLEQPMHFSPSEARDSFKDRVQSHVPLASTPPPQPLQMNFEQPIIAVDKNTNSTTPADEMPAETGSSELADVAQREFSSDYFDGIKISVL